MVICKFFLCVIYFFVVAGFLFQCSFLFSVLNGSKAEEGWVVIFE